MKILVMSQVFWPDSVAGSQHLTDLAEDMIARGHTVRVITSKSNYENPKIKYPKSEVYQGVRITRINQTSFGKATKIGRVCNFISFTLFLLWELLAIREGEYEVIIGLTVPPMASFLGILIARLKGMRFAYWVMDLQPELSIVAGYLKRESLAAKLLLRLGDFVYKKADAIIALDKYMASYISHRAGVGISDINVIPVWPVMNEVYLGPRLENPFRQTNKIADKIVVMYAGNHAVTHPLETLLQSALILKDDPRFLFVFIGGGVRKGDVTLFKEKYRLNNILQLPYQERNTIHFSLGAADIHVVIQGDGCTGFTHPNKVYGAMFIGRPILYIGPDPSHITDLLGKCEGNISRMHGEADILARELRNFAETTESERTTVGSRNMKYAQENLTRQKLSGQIISVVEGLSSPAQGGR